MGNSGCLTNEGGGGGGGSVPEGCFYVAMVCSARDALL